MSWRIPHRPGTVLLFLLLVLPSCALAAQQTNVIIRVRTLRGTPLMGHALVRLTARVGSFDQTTSTREAGEAIFTNVMVGNYIAEVSSPGYLTAQEEVFVTMSGNGTTVVVNLTPEPEPGAKPEPGALPVLAPKAQAEIDKALEAMRKNDLQEARKRLEKVVKMAPGHPDIYYLFGMLYLQMNDSRQAKANLEKAVSLYAGHARALAALGDVLSREGDYAGAIRVLEKSLEHDADTWQTHGLLASALYHEKQYEKARIHAQRAVDLSRGRSPEARLLLAQVLLALGERKQARPHLEAFLQEAPNHPSAAAVRRMLEPPAAVSAAAPTASVVPAVAPPLDIRVARPEPPVRSWAPPDVDETQPTVTNDVPCSLPDVEARASRRARILVSSLEHITATERIEHAIMGGSGEVLQSERREFNYIVTIRQYKKDALSVDEDRTGRTSFYAFSSGVAAMGLSAMALVFHPFYAPSYEMRCEGLGQWNGQPAWVVNFRQQPDHPNRFRTYRTGKGVFVVKLKGRAWLATNTGDVLHLETDLMEPIPEAQLTRDHLVIDYAPQRFDKMKTQLWLPVRAELYSELKGKRYRIRHSLRDFMLFSVDVAYEIQQLPEPPPPEASGPGAASTKPPQKPPQP